MQSGAFRSALYITARLSKQVQTAVGCQRRTCMDSKVSSPLAAHACQRIRCLRQLLPKFK